MLDRMLPLFHHYYSPRQQLSLVRACFPPRTASQSSNTNSTSRSDGASRELSAVQGQDGLHSRCRNLHGWVKDCHWSFLGSASSVVHRLVENSQVTNKNHMLFMDHFYNFVALFHLLKNEMGVLAAGTVMPSSEHYPKELGKRLCRGGLCAITWKDCKPIQFLSNYHDPRRASTVNRHVGDQLAKLTAPQLVVDYTGYISSQLLFQQSDLLHLQGVGQHYPECSRLPPPTTSAWFVAPSTTST